MKQGFTLLEVILALALGVVVALVVQTMALESHRLNHAVSDEVALRAGSNRILDVLTADLSSLAPAQPIRLRDNVLQFHGLAAQTAIRQSVDVQYALEGGGSRCLIRRERPIGDKGWQHCAVLQSHVAAVSIEVHDGDRWHTTWPPSTPRPAAALRVTAQSDSGKVQHLVRIAPLVWRLHDE